MLLNQVEELLKDENTTLVLNDTSKEVNISYVENKRVVLKPFNRTVFLHLAQHNKIKKTDQVESDSVWKGV